ncbi:acetyltransferase [Enterococcus faecium]|uniref:acetyltransferase n=1 Tax=Enterococcus faecium TaxID=1352 RepID=UPI00187D0B9B|nr:acetyltransferase [Enterococcus faecium]
MQENLLAKANLQEQNFIVLIGGGDLAEYVMPIINAENKYRLLAICDDKYKEIFFDENIFFGPIETIVENLKIMDNVYFCITMGNPEHRKNVLTRLQILENKYANIIHPTAHIDTSAELGTGIIIGPQTIIGVKAKISSYSCIFSAIVEHHTQIGTCSTIAPGATICGGVSIETLCYIGANSTIIQYKNIGTKTIVGAHSLVLNDIPPCVTCYGVPAKIQKVHIAKVKI